MGRPKVVTIDDSQPVEEKKVSKKPVKHVESESVETNESVILEGAQRPIESEEKDAIASLQHDKTEPEEKTEQPTTQKKAQKPGKAKPRSKKYQEATKDLDKNKVYPLTEAVDMVKKLSYAKFNGTLEAHINTAQTGIRGLVSLPYVSGKKLVILAFGKGAEESGADLVGTDEIIEEINEQSSRPAGTKGKVNFDLVLTTPEWMPKLAKVARILGPRSLMPNPKNATITNDLKKAVESFQAGKTEYKTEGKAPLIHIALGKLDQPTKELSANIKTLLQTLGKSKVKKVSLSPTMGPAVKLDLNQI
ncbi:MAG: hypothetical protein Q7R49_03090 [Candidatus Daviesbacteria bacterium]|nr:hypothetical protein [Candidatus Daviesbacteria bacterium]